MVNNQFRKKSYINSISYPLSSKHKYSTLPLLTKPEGRQGKDLLHFAGAINIDDLSLMTQAIERDCEQVNADEW